MPTAGDRPPHSSRAADGRGLIWFEDAVILAAALALGACAFRRPLGLDGAATGWLLGVTLAAMVAVTVLRVRRVVRQRRAQAEGARGGRKDGEHAD